MPAETANINHCNIALIGTKFMGRAHSNAYWEQQKITFFEEKVSNVEGKERHEKK